MSEKEKIFVFKGEVCVKHDTNISALPGTITLPYMLSAQDFDIYWRSLIKEEADEKNEVIPEEKSPISDAFSKRYHLIRDTNISGPAAKTINTKNFKTGLVPYAFATRIVILTQELLNQAQLAGELSGESTDTTTPN